jgi:hypothetical protein
VSSHITDALCHHSIRQPVHKLSALSTLPRRPETGAFPHLGILYNEPAGREDEGDQGGREEHLDNGDISVVAAEDLGEGVAVVYSKALGGAWRVV